MFHSSARTPRGPFVLGPHLRPLAHGFSLLASVSSVGTYRGRFTLRQGPAGAYGAYLELGRVEGASAATVNGVPLPEPDRLNTTSDLGPGLFREGCLRPDTPGSGPVGWAL